LDDASVRFAALDVSAAKLYNFSNVDRRILTEPTAAQLIVYVTYKYESPVSVDDFSLVNSRSVVVDDPEQRRQSRLSSNLALQTHVAFTDRHFTVLAVEARRV